MRRSSNPGWRDTAAAALAADVIAGFPGFESVLVIGDPTATVADAAAQRGAIATRWGHRVGEGEPVTIWPAGGPYDLATIRLPKAKDELDLLLHAAADCLSPGGRLLVYGAKDEGVGSAQKRVAHVFGKAEAAAVGKRCRVWSATRPRVVEGLRSGLEAWRLEGEGGWFSYPGVFAAQGLDEGTALLLDNLPPLAAGLRILDFGCGSGWIGGRVLAECGGAEVDLFDIDAFAIAAAQANVAGARCVLGSLDDASGPYDLIVSNPPYHIGKGQTLGVIGELVDRGADLLGPDGELRFVVQRRFPVEQALEQKFRRVSRVADKGVFRVWSGSQPR